MSNISPGPTRTPITNRPETLYSLAITFQILVYLAVGFRLYVRFRIVNSPGWDDLLVLLATVSTTFGLVFVCFGVSHGMGRHFDELSFHDQLIYTKYFYLAFGTYNISTTLIKESLLVQYLRIFKDKWPRRLCYASILLVAVWGLVFSTLSWFPCWPVSGLWDPFINAKCYIFNRHNLQPWKLLLNIHAALNMCLDLWVLSIPIMFLLRRGVERKQLLALVALFTLGSATAGFSVARLIVVVQVRTTVYFDPSWRAPIGVILVILEIKMAIICASIPIFWPILVRLGFGKILVVQEVQVKTEDRTDSVGVDVRFAADEKGLPRNSSGGSEMELTRTHSENSVMRYYKDLYVMEQVIPTSDFATHEVCVERAEIPVDHIEAMKQ